MKVLIGAAALADALSVTAPSAQAQDETDRALGAGSYVHPNGPSKGIWTGAVGVRHVGALTTVRSTERM